MKEPVANGFEGGSSSLVIHSFRFHDSGPVHRNPTGHLQQKYLSRGKFSCWSLDKWTI